MRLNAKDLISGGLLLLLALIGLWLNLDHTLGSARRMGPGYMPMLAFALLAFLGGFVIIAGLFNGPDPLDKWSRLEVLAVPLGIVAFFIGYFIAEAVGFTSWYPLGWGALAGCLAISVAPGWRPLGLVHAGLAVFGLMLEQFGLMLSIAACVAVASLAEPHHRVKGVVGMILFLCALCWLVFIVELDIRVPVWPVFLTQ
jgi:vacuolar-type H+-ATPase subunit I/STV1